MAELCCSRISSSSDFKNNDGLWLSCLFTCTLQAFLLLCETERISLSFATSSTMKCLVVCEENNTCQACRSPLHKFAYETQDHRTPCRVTASHSWHCTWNSTAKRAISFAESFKTINFVFSFLNHQRNAFKFWELCSERRRWMIIAITGISQYFVRYHS